jgi:hypothetical protein
MKLFKNTWKVFVFEFLFLTLFILNSKAFADANRHEFYLGSGSVILGGSATNINLSPGYNFTILPWLQAGGSISYSNSNHKETSVNSFTVFAGPTFNIGPNLTDAIYISVGLALRSVSSSNDGLGSGTESSSTTSSSSGSSEGETEADPSGFGYGIFVGKRFAIANGFSYRPFVGAVQAGTMSFVIQALTLSYSF